MKLSKSIFRVAAAEKGTEVIFQLNKVMPETQEESESLAELRKQITVGESMLEGKATTEFKIVIVSDPPFNGRFAYPEKRNGDDVAFSMFSHQATEILFAQKYGTGTINQIRFESINSSPAADTGGYALISGDADGNPCVMIFSKDRQRQLVIACRKKRVITSVLGHLLGHAPVDCVGKFDNRILSELPEFGDYERRWDRIKEEVEVLLVNVKTLSQALHALVKYRNYLEEVEEEQGALTRDGK
jgi:hypothetical protein